MSTFILRKERTFGQKVEATFEFIRLTRKPLFKSMLFFTAPFVLIGTFVVANVFSRISAIAVNTGEGLGASEGDLMSIGLSVFGLAFLLIFAGTMVVSVVFATMRIYEGQDNADFTHKQVWKMIGKVYWPIFGSVFLHSTVIGILYLLSLIPIGIIMQISPFLALPLIYLFLGFCGVVAFTALSNQILDRHNIGKSVSVAFKLLKNNWWASLGLFLVLMIIYNVVRLIFLLPIYVSTILQSLFVVETGSFEIPLWQEMLNYILGGIFLVGSFFSYMIPLVGMNLQFFSMSEAKDAKTLIKRIDNLGESQEEEEEDY